MIAHTGSHTRDLGPRCSNCQIRSVRFEGATCSLCQRDIRDKRAFEIVLIIFLLGALMMAASSAFGTWMWINVDRPKMESKLHHEKQLYDLEKR